MTRISVSAIALVSALCAAPALAEEAADPTIIVTATTQRDEAEAQANRTAGGTDVVSHADYADKSIVSLRDTLAFSPGVYAQPRYGQEVRISIRGSGLSRGFHMRGLTLLQDGVPINLADDNGDFQELEPIFFDHLEVYRGANALRFGSGTLGGAINGVTPNGRNAKGVYVRADVGSFDSYRLLVSGGTATDRVDAWAAISTDSSSGDRDHLDRKSLRFHGNVGLKLADSITTRLYASYNNIDQEIPSALTREQALTTPRYAAPSTIANDQGRDITSLRLQNRTTVDWGNATLNVGVFLNAKSLYHPIFQVVDSESVDHGAYARLDYSAGPLEFTLGGEARFGTVAAKRFINVGGKRGAKSVIAEQRAQTANVYGEVRLKPVDGLTLIAGGIYADGMRKQHETYNLALGGPRDVSARADFSKFSPKFGVLFDAGPNVQFFANYSQSAEFPGFIELAQVSAFVPVAAQTAWTWETGTRGKSGIIEWDLAVYRANVSGELLQYTVDTSIPAATFNAGKTIHQGIEAALSLTPVDGVRLRAVYNHSDFRFQDDGQYGDNRLPVVPRDVLRGEVRLGGDALHIAPNVEWVPSGPFADYRNTTRTPGYALLGVSAGATIAPGVDVFVDARNLTGKKAIGDVSAVILATPASAIYYPVERRAVYGGVRARF